MKSICLLLILFVFSVVLPVSAQVDISKVNDSKANDAKAILVCVPGLTENPCTFKKFAKDMAACGVTTCALDVKGYEVCQAGQKQQKIDFNRNVQEIVDKAKDLRIKNPRTPVFLLGESTGGAIALRTAALHPECFDGLICTVPTWKVRSTLKIGGLEVLDLTVCRGRKKGLAVNLVIKRATDKKEVQAALMAANMRRQRFSVVETAKFVRFMNAGPHAACDIKDLPVLFIDGLKDKVSKPNGCAYLFNKIASKRKTYVLDAEAGHLICEEGQFSRPLFLTMKNWISKAIEKDLPLEPCAKLISADCVNAQDSISIQRYFKCAGVTPNAVIAKNFQGQISSLAK